MTLYGLGGPYYDIISKYRSNKAQILIFIKIAIGRALVWGVDLGHLLGYTPWVSQPRRGLGMKYLGCEPRGHSLTTLTSFLPILTPYPPIVDIRWHFSNPLPNVNVDILKNTPTRLCDNTGYHIENWPPNYKFVLIQLVFFLKSDILQETNVMRKKTSKKKSHYFYL